MEIIYFDKKHEEITVDCLKRMGEKADYADYKALAYLLGLDTVCREHISQIFDFEKNSFKVSCFNQSWQTGSSIRTTRLMYMLFADCVQEDKAEQFAVNNIFDYATYNEFYFNALRIRYGIH